MFSCIKKSLGIRFIYNCKTKMYTEHKSLIVTRRKWVICHSASYFLCLLCTIDLVPSVHNFFFSSQRLHEDDCQNCIYNLKKKKRRKKFV